MKYKPRLDDFWAKVVIDATPRHVGISPCWTYIGADAGGYGRFSSVYAHRVAAAIYCVAVPSKVYQRCGNRRCVRLEHLAISLLVNRKPKVSRLTGKEIPIPRHKDVYLAEKVLDSRGDVQHRKVSELAILHGTTQVVVKKILLEAAIHDVIAEIKEHREQGTEYRTYPHKHAATLVGSDYTAYERLILSNLKPE